MSTKFCYKFLKLDPRMLYSAKLYFDSNIKVCTDILKHERKHISWASLEKDAYIYLFNQE